MIVLPAPPLLLVACPGTRGRWFGKVARALPGAQSISDPLLPAWCIAEDEALVALRSPSLLRVGLVRDPWSWYAETWMEAMRSGGPARDAIRAWGNGSTAFRDFLYGATHPEKVLDMPAQMGVAWTPRADGARAGLLASTLGLCAFSFLYHYGTRDAWQAPSERPSFAVDVLVDGNDPENAVRLLLNLEASATLPQPPGPPPAVREAVRLGYDATMLRWVAEADRPILTAMRYGPFTKAGVGPLFSVRRAGAIRKESVTPRPVSEVEAQDRNIVEMFRAARNRRPAGEAAPETPATFARLAPWIERPG